jgi:hypothetical protein
MRDEPAADPAIIRSLDTGQAAYIYRGGVTYVQVKRLIAAPPALPRDSPSAAGPSGPPRRERRFPVETLSGDTAGAEQRAALPDAGPLLDEAFGPGQA